MRTLGMRKVTRSPLALSALLAVALTTGCGTSGSAAESEDAESFFAGETVRLVVPFSSGGGFDTYARIVAPYLEEALGTTVVVENRPGAGGLLAVNNLSIAEPDGLTLAMMNGVGAAGASLAEAEGAQFSLDDLSYVGLFGEAGSMVVVPPGSPHTTAEELVAADSLTLGATGPGADDFLSLVVFTSVFGMDSEIVTGFDGSQEVSLAMARGEIAAMSSGYGTGLPAVRAGDHQPLVALDDEPLPAVPDVPLVVDMDYPSETAREIMETHLQLLSFTRPLVAPAGVPAERLEFLREALSEAAANPQLKADLEKTDRTLIYMNGEEADALVAELLKAPSAYVELMKTTY
jgi:tripartite-type tricarboxylate transporter receptor subunit TctC